MGVHGRTFNIFISGSAAKTKSLKAHKKPMSSNGQNGGGGVGGKNTNPNTPPHSQQLVSSSSNNSNSSHQTPMSPPTLAVTTDTAPSSSGSNTNTAGTVINTAAVSVSGASAAAATAAAATTSNSNEPAAPTTSTSTSNMAVDSSPRESGDDSEDESEILEESPCGRWLKRREEVDQRDVPGIDCVHLAMDTEEGVEVVWNEVQYASLQELKSQEDKMRQVFDNLLQLDHQNIVKFHRYWTDTHNTERPRVIFITEYMSSGSLKQFLKRTKRNAKRLPLEAWRRWCTQILSALSYLHSCTPPVIHGNLTCDSIFIQHNGLVKIGSVVPDAVHYNVRQQQQHNSKADERGAQHFMAPEYGSAEQLTAAVDIYAFGMCALEMAALEIQPSSGGGGGGGVGSSDHSSDSINEETILRTINSLEHDLQRDLIFKCLRRNPNERPSANDLLFHPLLFEVHSLKLLAAHCLVHAPKNRTMFSETVIDGMMQQYNRPEVIMAKVTKTGEEHDYRLCDVQAADKLEKFVEDVKFGVYPLTAYTGKKAPPHFKSRAASPENVDSVKSATPETVDIESRRIVNMMCSVKKLKDDSTDISMTILLRMDDKMNRQLTCQVTESDSAEDLTNELVHLGFVHIDDQDKIQALLEETLRGSFAAFSEACGGGGQPLTFSATINEPTTTTMTMISGSSSSGGGGGGACNAYITGGNNLSGGANAAVVSAGAGGGGIYANADGQSGAEFGDSGVASFLKSAAAASTTTTTTTTVGGGGQFERNWSVADADPTIMFNQITIQQQHHQHHQLNSPMQQQQQQQQQQHILQHQLPSTSLAETINHSNVISDASSSSIQDVNQHEQQQQQQLQQHENTSASSTGASAAIATNTTIPTTTIN